MRPKRGGIIPRGMAGSQLSPNSGRASISEFFSVLRDHYVAAFGGGVSVVATFVAALWPAVPNPWLVGSTAVVCGVLSTYAIWAQERNKRVEAEDNLRKLEEALKCPDVWLEGTFPAPFRLHARGHACEIRTGPIVQESGLTGTFRIGGEARPVYSQRCEITFSVVSDLRDGDQELQPTVYFGGSAWPEAETARSGVTQFFQNAVHLRRVAIGEPDTNTCTVDDMNAFAERIRQPLTFPFEITFWNHDRTRQWTRSEVLVYAPTTAEAFVRHEGEPAPMKD